MKTKNITLFSLLLILSLITTNASSETVNGTMLIPGQSAYNGVGVSLIESNDGTEYTSFTDQAGNYIFNHIPVGAYRVIGYLEGFEVNTSVLFRVDADTVAPSLLLKYNLGRISGRVELEDLDYGSYAGIFVGLRGTNLGVLTDGAGRFAIEDVSVGQYSVTASLDGYLKSVYSDVSVKAYRSTTIRDMTLLLQDKSATDIRASVDGIDTHIDGILDDIDKLQDYKTDIISIEGDISLLTTDISKLKTFQSTYEQYDIGGLIPEFIVLQDVVDKQQADLEAMDDKTSQAIQEIMTRLGEHDSSITSLTTSIDNTILEVDSRVVKLEKTVSIILDILEKKYSKQLEEALVE